MNEQITLYLFYLDVNRGYGGGVYISETNAPFNTDWKLISEISMLKATWDSISGEYKTFVSFDTSRFV